MQFKSSQPLSVGSICSGIGAPETAWRDFGWRFAWQAEIEPFPSAVLAVRYPGVPNLGDMTAIADRITAGDVAAPDILVGGTPCQSFSVAGLRKGLGDARGNLALEFIRLADAIDAVRRAAGLQPCVVLWENVPGVLSDKGNAFGCFLSGLAGEDAPLVPPRGKWTDAGMVLGPERTAAWRILDAQFFGLAQRRRRVFVVASARSGFDPGAVLLECEGMRRDSPPSREAREDAPAGAGRGAARGGGSDDGAQWRPADGSGVITSGLDGGRVAQALNAFPTAAGRYDISVDTFIAFSSKDHGADAREGISPTLRAMAHGDSHANGGGQVAVCVTGQVTHTLRAEGAPTLQATGTRGGIRAPQIVAAAIVRRLTPIECERLQGFPDGWTAIAWRGKAPDDCPDGPRYRALGNSMAVPCMAWIGLRIGAEIARSGQP